MQGSVPICRDSGTMQSPLATSLHGPCPAQLPPSHAILPISRLAAQLFVISFFLRCRARHNKQEQARA